MTDEITYTSDLSFDVQGNTIPKSDIYLGLAPDNRDTDPIETMLVLRNGIESLPEYSSSFKLKRIAGGISRGSISGTMLELCGVWRMPVAFRNSSSNDSYGLYQYINPNAPDAWMYSDVYPKCECGALVTTMGRGGQTIDLPARTDHTEECIPLWRWRAQTKLAENRRQEMKRQFHLGRTVTEMGHRVGYTYPELKHSHYDHGVTPDEREVHRRYTAATAVVHLDRHSPNTIADALGYSRYGLEGIINDYYDIDYGALYDARKASGVASTGVVCDD